MGSVPHYSITIILEKPECIFYCFWLQCIGRDKFLLESLASRKSISIDILDNNKYSTCLDSLGSLASLKLTLKSVHYVN